LLKYCFVATLLEILVSVLIILKVNVNLCELIPELLLTGTHPPIAGIEHHDVFELMIHQVHDHVVVVFGLCERLRQCEQLPEPHPLRLWILCEGHISVFEVVEQGRVGC
jgi:hypothetical protein